MKTNAKVYRLTNGRTPLSLRVANRHTASRDLLWWDEKKQESRPLRYATNQKSIFEDEQSEHVVLKPIFFEDGTLVVTNREKLLQVFLDYHPDNVKNGGGLFYEQDHKAEAQAEIEAMDLEFEAQKIAREMSIQ